MYGRLASLESPRLYIRHDGGNQRLIVHERHHPTHRASCVSCSTAIRWWHERERCDVNAWFVDETRLQGRWEELCTCGGGSCQEYHVRARTETPPHPSYLVSSSATSSSTPIVLSTPKHTTELLIHLCIAQEDACPGERCRDGSHLLHASH